MLMDALSVALYNAGCKSLSDGNTEIAQRIFEICLELDPGNMKARTNVVFCKGMQRTLYRGRAKTAVEALRGEDPLFPNYLAFYQGVFNVITSHVADDPSKFRTVTGR